MTGPRQNVAEVQRDISMARTIEEGRIRVWADGFGIWHARVPLSMAFPMGAAKIAIRLALQERAPRDEQVPMPHVRVVFRDEENNTVEYMEDTTRDDRND
jgi:hypothetical protein